MRHHRRLIVLSGSLLAPLLLLGGGTVAQEAGGGVPGARSAHVHEGTCSALSGPDFVEPLTDLEVPAGDALGAEEAIAAAVPVAISFTTLDLALAEVLEEPHAIDVHRSSGREDRDTFVACGEIAGVPGPDGGIAVALRTQAGSGISGIAYLAPSPSNPSRSIVSLLVAEGLAGEAEAETGAEEAPRDEDVPSDEAPAEDADA